jgi:cyclohexanecarboxylate-CoA ligase
MYFLTGLAALATQPVTIVGQKYFQRRPIGPLLHALTGLGVELSSPDGCSPISVQPKRPTGGHVSIAGTLSQWISGLLLLAPFATGRSVVTVEGDLNERTYIDLTIRMMAQFGLRVEVGDDWRRFEIEPGQQARPATITLPPDVGAAAFGLAVTALHPSDVTFRGLSALSAAETDHPEADLIDTVRAMGLPMTRERPGGPVRVRHDGIRLAPVEVDCTSVPDMLPVLSVLAAFADGTSMLDNVAHVRLKEADRVSAMLQLNRMGGHLEQHPDRLTVHGTGGLAGADLSSFNDHRVLMSLAVAASRADGESRLTYPNAYRISYPRFLLEMGAIGLDMSIEAAAPGRRPRAAGPGSSRAAPSRAALSPAAAAAVPIGAGGRQGARQRPDATAVTDTGTPGPGRTWTWAELDAQADQVASLLLELGVQPGEPVAYQLPNWGEFVVITLAALRIGAVCCPLMPIYREHEMAFMLRRSGARVLFVPGRFRGRDYPAEVSALLSAPAKPALAHVVVINPPHSLPDDPDHGPTRWVDYAAAVNRQRPGRAALADRVPVPTGRAQLLFTSGTSGEPKGVVHRMDALSRAAAMEVRQLGLTSADRIFIPSPLAHQTGFLYGMWLSFVLGAAQILQPVWDGRAALRALRGHGGTFLQAATPARRRARPASRGRSRSCPRPRTPRPPARVTDDGGNVLAPGQEGNFEVHSPTLFEGYLDHPEWTAEAMTPDGWYRSGDLASIDAAGYVRITGRVKDVINRGGEKIPVAEIEQLLHTHPLVREIAIVATPDERLGERACAFAVAGPEFDFAEMQRFLDGRQVAKQYWPERLEVIESMPRNPAGKIKKFVLRDRARMLGE